MQNDNIKLLSDIVVYNKYAKYRPTDKRRETWEEIIDRYILMMLTKYTDKHTVEDYKNKKVSVEKDSLAYKIIKNSKFLYDKKVLPSMRALQFAGPAIEKNEARIYNCSYLPIDDYRAFGEIMFLLLGGTGVGYSVQYNHIEKLPEIQKPTKEAKYLVSDSIEGWSDAVKQLMKAYLGVTKVRPRFDYSDIREKGEQLVTAGGKAPGPDPLRIALVKIESILNNKKNGTKLTTIEVHDIICHIADAVLAGGIRRAALISLFSMDDKSMLTCKSGNWWELNPQRGRANNSAVILRNRIKKDEFLKIWNIVEESKAGEPGFYFTNNPEYGTNPLIDESTYNICILN
jgi:ribonucleoside-diphosphate reductase alpha chain